MKYLLIVILLFSHISFSNEINDSIFEVDVSKEKYNRVVLPVPYKNVIFSKGAKIDKPIKLNSGRLMLIRPKASALQAFSATFVLANDESFQVIFNPVLKDRPSIWRYRDASDIQGSVGTTLNDKHLWLARLFPEAHDLYYGRMKDDITAPKGFTRIETGNSLSVAVKGREQDGGFSELTLKPTHSWRGMGHVLQAYILSSTLPVEIEPSDFWFDGVVAVSTEFDFVSRSKTPYVFILVKE